MSCDKCVEHGGIWFAGISIAHGQYVGEERMEPIVFQQGNEGIGTPVGCDQV